MVETFHHSPEVCSTKVTISPFAALPTTAASVDGSCLMLRLELSVTTVSGVPAANPETCTSILISDAE